MHIMPKISALLVLPLLFDHTLAPCRLVFAKFLKYTILHVTF